MPPAHGFVPEAYDGVGPRVVAVLTMFYYRDLPAAAAWYERTLGFRRIRGTKGFVLFEIGGTAQLCLIDGNFGSQRPIDGTNKGAMLSIQTDNVERWHDTLAARGVEGAGHGLTSGAGGATTEFKVRDPEGYTIEFFRWI